MPAKKYGVEMRLIIIGEAAGQIPEEIQEVYTQISRSLMRVMRNHMAHVCFSVDEHLLWETTTEELDELVPCWKLVYSHVDAI